MGFSNKLGLSGEDERIRFLSAKGFRENKEYENRKGYFRMFNSDFNMDLDYIVNTVIVYVESDIVHVENYVTDSFGWGIRKLSRSEDVESATEDVILKMINDVLPDDLD